MERSGLVAVGFLVVLTVYWGWYFCLETVEGLRVYERLTFLLLPDRLWADWCGGPLGRVELSDRTAPLVGVAVIGLVATVLGLLVLDLLGVRQHCDRLETAVLAVGVGLSGISLFTLMVGLAGGLRQPRWFILLGVAVVAAGCWRWWGSLRRRPRGLSEEHGEKLGGGGEAWSWWRSPWLWAATPFIAVIIAGGILPPMEFDVLEYHLQVPKEWYLQGRITFLPHNVYGNMPLASELLALPAMALMPGELSWWWGALTGKLLMALFVPLTALLLFAIARRHYSVRAGLVAALIYLSTAWVAYVALNGLNEGVVAYYLLASFYCGRLVWMARDTTDDAAWGLVILCGLLAGAAIACKYTALVFVFLPLTVVMLLGARRKRILTLAIFTGAVVLVCGLWFGKNWVQTGNPTYPLLVQWFDGKTRTAEKDLQWRHAHQVPRDAQGHTYSLGQAGAATLEVLGGSWRQNALIAPFMLLLVLRFRANRDFLYWLSLTAFVLVAWWLVTHRVSRFWVPAIPLMALLAGLGATWSAEVIWRRTAATVLGLGLLLNFLIIVAPNPSLADNRYFVSLEQLRDDPQMTAVFGGYREIAFACLAEQVRAPARVLVVGDAALFSLRVPALYNTCFDDCQFEALFRGRDRRERLKRLQELAISHIYIDWSELRRYRQPGNYGYSSYVTEDLVHRELVAEQGLLRPLRVPGLESDLAEILEVVGE